MDRFTSALDSQKAMRSGDISATELVEFALTNIAEIDHSGYELRSVLALSPSARSEAEEVDRHKGNRPLEGLPILIKDNIEAVGLPATAGSLALAGDPIKQDSELVARLKAAGAVVVGATNLSEWANIRSWKSTSGWSGVGGLTANPWIHKHSAGGSSSGSGAAVAAGLTTLAIGSETDGSIVCPASVNGCVGIKPTVGSVPRTGMIPISASQDSPGPMGRSVADVALLLEVMTGNSGYLRAALQPEEIRIGVVREWLTASDATNQIFEESISLLRQSGVQVHEVVIAAPEESVSADEFAVLMYELHDDLATYLSDRSGSKIKTLSDVVDFNTSHSDLEMQYFQQEIFDKALELGGRSGDYHKIRARNFAWADQTLAVALANVDVLVGAAYGPSWVSALGAGDDYASASWISMAPAIAGTPIGALPMGLVSGLPVAIGVVTGRNQEKELVTAMALIERILGLGVLRPTFRK
ncbi:MAG: amidase family protein [Actinomycetes bacterium]